MATDGSGGKETTPVDRRRWRAGGCRRNFRVVAARPPLWWSPAALTTRRKWGLGLVGKPRRLTPAVFSGATHPSGLEASRIVTRCASAAPRACPADQTLLTGSPACFRPDHQRMRNNPDREARLRTSAIVSETIDRDAPLCTMYRVSSFGQTHAEVVVLARGSKTSTSPVHRCGRSPIFATETQAWPRFTAAPGCGKACQAFLRTSSATRRRRTAR